MIILFQKPIVEGTESVAPFASRNILASAYCYVAAGRTSGPAKDSNVSIAQLPRVSRVAAAGPCFYIMESRIQKPKFRSLALL